MARPAFYGGVFGGFLLGVLAMLVYLLSQPPHTYPVPPPVLAQGSTLVIRLDAPTMNKLVTTALANVQNQLPATLSTITTYPHANNTLDVNAVAHTSTVSGAVAFTFSPQVDAATGAIHMRLVSAQVGQLPIPNLQQSVQSAIDAQLADYSHGQLALGMNYQVIDARVTASAMVLTVTLQ